MDVSQHVRACSGYASPVPNHLLQIDSDLQFEAGPITVDARRRRRGGRAQTQGGLRLLLSTPDGEFLCSEEGHAPFVVLNTWVPGTHRVWLTVDRSDVEVDYTLFVSNMP